MTISYIEKKILIIFFVNLNLILFADTNNRYIDQMFLPVKNGLILDHFANKIVDICVLSNGCLICGGISEINNKKNFFLTYLNKDGLLNKSFGQNGIVNVQIGDSDLLTSVINTMDNKILACGSTFINGKTSIAIVKYNYDGSLDKNFGNKGIVIISLFAGISANCLCIDKENKIIISGGVVINGIGHSFLIKLNSDGTIDESFGKKGMVFTLVDNQTDSNSILYQKDEDKIITAGYTRNAKTGIYESILIRYTSEGTIDQTFEKNGISNLKIEGTSSNYANSMQFSSDGSIVLLGFTNKNNLNHIYVAKFTKNGQLDKAFGTSHQGISFLNMGYDTMASDIAVDENDNIFVSGHYLSESKDYRFCVYKLKSNGLLDYSFGDQGMISTKIGSHAKTNVICLQKNSPIVGGFSDDKMALVKYVPNNEPYIKLSNEIKRFRGSKQKILIDGVCSEINAKVIVKLDGKIIDSAITDSNGIWKVDQPYYLCNGKHKIEAYFSINEKIIQTKKNLNINAENSIIIESPQNNSCLLKNKIEISGISSQPNKKIKITIDGVLYKMTSTDADGRWDAGLISTLSNGSHQIIAELLDDSDEIIKSHCDIIVNSFNNIVIKNPVKNSRINSLLSDISGSSSLSNAEVLVYLNEKFISLTNTDNFGNWQAKVSSKIRSGINIASVKLIDPITGSNLASSNINFTY